MQSPRVRHESSLTDDLRRESSGYLHSHTLNRIRAVILRQGFPSPGLFLIVRGEVLVQKELEIVVGGAIISASTPAAAAAAAAALAAEKGIKPRGGGGHKHQEANNNAINPVVQALHRKAIKPVQVALLGVGDYFGDIGLLDGATGGGFSSSSSSSSASSSGMNANNLANSEARRSPVTILSNSAQLELQFIKRSDMIRLFSKPLLRALRAHSQARTSTHAARVQKVIDALGGRVAGAVRAKGAATALGGYVAGSPTAAAGGSSHFESKLTSPSHRRTSSSVSSQHQAPGEWEQHAWENFWGSSEGNADNMTVTMTHLSPLGPVPSTPAFGVNSSPLTGPAASPDFSSMSGSSVAMVPLSLNSSPVLGPMTPGSHRTSDKLSTALTAPSHHPSSSISSASASKQQQQPTVQQPVVTKAMIEERKAKAEKDKEALQESLNRRYQNMKLKAKKMYFPDALLDKITAHVNKLTETSLAMGGAGANVPVSKNLETILQAHAASERNQAGAAGSGTTDGKDEPTPSNQSAMLHNANRNATLMMAADASEKETKDAFKFLGEALRSAETRRGMTITNTPGDSASAKKNTSHMAALLSNDSIRAQQRFEANAAANKLGALDTLLKEERKRQQLQRDMLLGEDHNSDTSRSKRGKIPSHHFNSLHEGSLLSAPSSGASSVHRSHAVHPSLPLRGAEALLAKAARDRAEEEQRIALMARTIEKNFLGAFRSAAAASAGDSSRPGTSGGILGMSANIGSLRPNTAPDNAVAGAPNNTNALALLRSGGGGTANSVQRQRFLVNAGLDADFLTGNSNVAGGSLTERRKYHQRKVTNERSGAATATNAAPSYYESLHKLAATPAEKNMNSGAASLLSSIYTTGHRGDGFSNLHHPELQIARSQARSERFGRDMESLPRAPPVPKGWKEQKFKEKLEERKRELYEQRIIGGLDNIVSGDMSSALLDEEGIYREIEEEIMHAGRVGIPSTSDSPRNAVRHGHNLSMSAAFGSHAHPQHHSIDVEAGGVGDGSSGSPTSAGGAKRLMRNPSGLTFPGQDILVSPAVPKLHTAKMTSAKGRAEDAAKLPKSFATKYVSYSNAMKAPLNIWRRGNTADIDSPNSANSNENNEGENGDRSGGDKIETLASTSDKPSSTKARNHRRAASHSVGPRVNFHQSKPSLPLVLTKGLILPAELTTEDPSIEVPPGIVEMKMRQREKEAQRVKAQEEQFERERETAERSFEADRAKAMQKLALSIDTSNSPFNVPSPKSGASIDTPHSAFALPGGIMAGTSHPASPAMGLHTIPTTASSSGTPILSPRSVSLLLNKGAKLEAETLLARGFRVSAWVTKRKSTVGKKDHLWGKRGHSRLKGGVDLQARRMSLARIASVVNSTGGLTNSGSSSSLSQPSRGPPLHARVFAQSVIDRLAQGRERERVFAQAREKAAANYAASVAAAAANSGGSGSATTSPRNARSPRSMRISPRNSPKAAELGVARTNSDKHLLPQEVSGLHTLPEETVSSPIDATSSAVETTPPFVQGSPNFSQTAFQFPAVNVSSTDEASPRASTAPATDSSSLDDTLPAAETENAPPTITITMSAIEPSEPIAILEEGPIGEAEELGQDAITSAEHSPLAPNEFILSPEDEWLIPADPDAPPPTVPGANDWKSRSHYLHHLREPSMIGVGTQRTKRVRGVKEGTGPCFVRFVSRGISNDDPSIALHSLTPDMAATPRMKLLHAIQAMGVLMRRKWEHRKKLEAAKPKFRRTDQLLQTQAALHTINRAPQPGESRPATANTQPPEETRMEIATEESKEDDAADGDLQEVRTSVPLTKFRSTLATRQEELANVEGSVLREVMSANLPKLGSLKGSFVEPETSKEEQKKLDEFEANLSPKQKRTAGNLSASGKKKSAKKKSTEKAKAEEEEKEKSIEDSTTSSAAAAASGALAQSVSPLSVSLHANGLGGVLTGLTAVGQMMPADSKARKLAEIYAHFQRHLARSRDYFLEQSLRDRLARQAREREAEAKRKLEAIDPNDEHRPPPGRTQQGGTLHRVDEDGFIQGPDRTTPTLAPAAIRASLILQHGVSRVDAALTAENIGASGIPLSASNVMSPTSSISSDVPTLSKERVASEELSRSILGPKLNSAGGARRRGGGHLGMLEDQSPEQMAESLRVLSDMLSRASLENEQALRVLNSYDKKQLLYLPAALLQRAAELHALLHKRLAEEAEAKELKRIRSGPDTSGTASAKKEKGLFDESSSESEEDSEDDGSEEAKKRKQHTEQEHLAHLRTIARRKAKAKFRHLTGVVNLFPTEPTQKQLKGHQEQLAALKAQGRKGKNLFSNLSPNTQLQSEQHAAALDAAVGATNIDHKESKEEKTSSLPSTPASSTRKVILSVENEAARRIVSAITEANAVAAKKAERERSRSPRKNNGVEMPSSPSSRPRPSTTVGSPRRGAPFDIASPPSIPRPSTSSGIPTHRPRVMNAFARSKPQNGEGKGPSAPLPPPFMALYHSFGLHPTSTEGFVPASRAGTPVTPPPLTLLDIVRARANLERKLKQEEFIANAEKEQEDADAAAVAGSSDGKGSTLAPSPRGKAKVEDHLSARARRRAELESLQAEEMEDRKVIDRMSSMLPVESIAYSKHKRRQTASRQLSNASTISSSTAEGSESSFSQSPSLHASPEAVVSSLYANQPSSDDEDDASLDVDAMLNKMAQHRASQGPLSEDIMAKFGIELRKPVVSSISNSALAAVDATDTPTSNE